MIEAGLLALKNGSNETRQPIQQKRRQLTGTRSFNETDLVDPVSMNDALARYKKLEGGFFYPSRFYEAAIGRLKAGSEANFP